MKRSSLLALFLLVPCLAAKAATTDEKLPKLSGPHAYENLTIYLIHGPDTIKAEYLTLEEGMAAKKVIVHETGDVNTLAIENKSDRPVYIQSGDIVKGGKQDRTLGNDLVLAPHSPKVPIASFCVEHGRWEQCGREPTDAFSSSRDAVAGTKMKLAASGIYSGKAGQQQVWDEAKENQAKLARRTSSDISANAGSSFQLTVEDKNVQAAVEKYVRRLGSAAQTGPDIVGYAAVINGKLACADSYGSSHLFRKLWPKMLKSAAVEAAAEYSPAAAQSPIPTADEVRALLAKAAEGEKRGTQVSERVHVSAYDANDSVLFETRDLKNSSAAVADSYLHRSYLRKDD